MHWWRCVPWGYPDPSDTPGGPEEVAAAFLDTARSIAKRLTVYFAQELALSEQVLRLR